MNCEFLVKQRRHKKNESPFSIEMGNRSVNYIFSFIEKENLVKRLNDLNELMDF